MRLKTLCPFCSNAGPLPFGELHLQGGCYLHRYLIMYRKNLIEFSIVTFSPKVIPSGRINQLGRDSELIPTPADAAFEHVLHSQLAAHLLNMDGFLISVLSITRPRKRPFFFSVSPVKSPGAEGHQRADGGVEKKSEEHAPIPNGGAQRAQRCKTGDVE